MDFNLKKLFDSIWYCNRYVKEVDKPICSSGRFYKKKSIITNELLKNAEKYGISYEIKSVETNKNSFTPDKKLIGIKLVGPDCELEVHQEYSGKITDLIDISTLDLNETEYKSEPDCGEEMIESRFIECLKTINEFVYGIKYNGSENKVRAFVNAEYFYPEYSFCHHKRNGWDTMAITKNRTGEIMYVSYWEFLKQARTGKIEFIDNNFK